MASIIPLQPMVDVLSRHRHPLSRAVLGAGCVLATGAIAVALLRYPGDWVTQRFLIFYMAPLFLFGAAWAYRELRAAAESSGQVLVVYAFVFVAGALRAGGGWGVLPYSGHMLFLTFVVLAARQGQFRWVALVLAVMTTWFKLALWHDWRTWTLGVAAGVIFALIQRRIIEPELRAPTETIPR